MNCVACGAPLDDDIDLCDECFRVMPVDEMVSASDINDIRNRPVPTWLGHEMYGEKVIAWREFFDTTADEWRYKVYTSGGSTGTVYTVTAEGYAVSAGHLYMVDPDDHPYSPDCHCQECLTERQAMS